MWCECKLLTFFTVPGQKWRFVWGKTCLPGNACASQHHFYANKKAPKIAPKLRWMDIMLEKFDNWFEFPRAPESRSENRLKICSQYQSSILPFARVCSLHESSSSQCFFHLFFFPISFAYNCCCPIKCRRNKKKRQQNRTIVETVIWRFGRDFRKIKRWTLRQRKDL